MVESPHEPAEGDLGFNESDAVIRVVGRRGVVQREEHTCGGLQQKQEECRGAEHIDPAGPAGNRLIKQCPLDRLEVQAGSSSHV